MIKVTQISEIRQVCAEAHSVALVPTMGALHAGHLSLVEEGRRKVGSNGIVVVSIFVNPTQFDKQEDFQNYPNTLEDDLKLCEKVGVNAVFSPSVDEVYVPKASISVTETSLSNRLCGAKRPGHFDGVCTVVSKLFNIVQPHYAIFGSKDFQQLAIIRKMVNELNFPIKVIAASTVREEDGLALSSRNRRLSNQARKEAPLIYQSLKEIEGKLLNQDLPLSDIEPFFQKQLQRIQSETTIDYIELVDSVTLQTAQNLSGKTLLACAVFFDNVRLIDHILVDPVAIG